ncbi:hypothetical protein COLO4_05618 [Corchorus olitorius]|uniref:Leucine-rich repeat-containing N-terminal plant-type domain-containing protein n=1 Tax=Corchorus olitorius TaxID=93759 RepID=A0A1R3KQC1_9ROSI|nr:hypothetical protein COLO4_05618 [Corchorus olitorius]
MFKQDLIDDANRLASWIHLNEACCGWVGVVCDNLTAHVVELHLHNPQPVLDADKLRGNINLSLPNLKHLALFELKKQ